MAEAWRPVPDWPGYLASYGGDILSPNGVVLKRSHDTKDYPAVTVYGHGVKRTRRVHLLVASAWLPPVKGKPQVRHLDGDKENCAAWNLKRGDQADQENDKRHAGRSSRVKRGMMREVSERRGKEGNRTGAYRAGATRTSRTWPS